MKRSFFLSDTFKIIQDCFLGGSKSIAKKLLWKYTQRYSAGKPTAACPKSKQKIWKEIIIVSFSKPPPSHGGWKIILKSL